MNSTSRMQDETWASVEAPLWRALREYLEPRLERLSGELKAELLPLLEELRTETREAYFAYLSKRPAGGGPDNGKGAVVNAKLRELYVARRVAKTLHLFLGSALD